MTNIERLYHYKYIIQGGLIMDNNKLNQEFKTGDTVQLKSDGPIMTVHNIVKSDGSIYCQWFAGKKLENGYFPPGSLNRASVDEKEK